MTDQDRTCGRVQPHPRHKYLLDRVSRQCPGVPDSSVEVYFCPTSGEIEPTTGGGFDVCCAHPELHAYLGYRTPGIDAISAWLSDRAVREFKIAAEGEEIVLSTRIKDLVDREAGKVHSANGHVMTTLKQALALYRDELFTPSDAAIDRITQVVARNYLDSCQMVGEPLPGPEHPLWKAWREDAKAAIEAVRDAAYAKEQP